MILLRRSGKHRERGLEVLLVQRNPEARFMPGVWVFPGGAVDEGDRGGEEADGYRACAIRERREEAGIRISDDAIDDIGDSLSTAGGIVLVSAAILLPIAILIALVALAWRRSVRRGRERALGE